MVCRSKVLKWIVITVLVSQLVTVLERQVFDFLGYLWSCIVANFLEIISLLVGLFGVIQYRWIAAIVILIFSCIWIGWNIFIICFYLNVGVLSDQSNILNMGGGGSSWWVRNNLPPVTNSSSAALRNSVEILHSSFQLLLTPLCFCLVLANLKIQSALLKEEACQSIEDELEYVHVRRPTTGVLNRSFSNHSTDVRANSFDCNLIGQMNNDHFLMKKSQNNLTTQDILDFLNENQSGQIDKNPLSTEKLFVQGHKRSSSGPINVQKFGPRQRHISEDNNYKKERERNIFSDLQVKNVNEMNFDDEILPQSQQKSRQMQRPKMGVGNMKPATKNHDLSHLGSISHSAEPESHYAVVDNFVPVPSGSNHHIPSNIPNESRGSGNLYSNWQPVPLPRTSTPSRPSKAMKEVNGIDAVNTPYMYNNQHIECYKSPNNMDGKSKMKYHSTNHTFNNGFTNQNLAFSPKIFAPSKLPPPISPPPLISRTNLRNSYRRISSYLDTKPMQPNMGVVNSTPSVALSSSQYLQGQTSRDIYFIERSHGPAQTREYGYGIHAAVPRKSTTIILKNDPLPSASFI